MLSEGKSKIENRFLTTECRFSSTAIDIWKQETQIRCKAKDAYYNNYMNWQQGDNEMALFTYYAYADLSIPKKFDCLFDYKNPDRYVESNMILKHAIWEGWFPINAMEHGHKHLAIFEFEATIPEIIFELYKENNKYAQIPDNALCLGICELANYEAIKNKLANVQHFYNEHIL